MGLLHDCKFVAVNFVQYGWKAIFKVTILLLKENEEKMLDMPFEVILTQIVHLPIKFVVEESANVEQSRSQFDKQMQIKIPTILLERLKREFDESSHLLE